MRRVIAAIRELHKMLKIDKDFKKSDEELSSYDVAHHAGLTIEEEYELEEIVNTNEESLHTSTRREKLLNFFTLNKKSFNF